MRNASACSSAQQERRVAIAAISRWRAGVGPLGHSAIEVETP